VKLLDRVTARAKALSFGGGQGFSQPPFWTFPDDQPWSGTTPNEEGIEGSFASYIQEGLKRSSPVAGVIERRAQVFGQGRFMWQRTSNGIPGDPFGSKGLQLLERPWPKGSTGELLKRCEYDASLAGNSYWTIADDTGNLGNAARRSASVRFVRMRADWCKLLVDAPSGNVFGPDAVVVGLQFTVPMSVSGGETRRWIFLPNEFAHYAPIPDPIARFRGMSWLTPVLLEIDADVAATRHKAKFFENGATFARAIKFDTESDPAAVKRFRERYNDGHQGSDNAYKTLFLVPGADVVPLSTDFGQLDLKVTQGAGETRICVAAGVPPSIAGVSEGLAGSTLNAGNFQAARRLFIDTTVRDLWSIVASSFESLVDTSGLPSPDPGRRLIIDERFVPFNREDAAIQATTMQVEATMIQGLIKEGFTADSVVAAVRNRDWTLLKHTGMVSVQLHSPNESASMQQSTNGNGQMTQQQMQDMMASMNGGQSNGS